MIANNSARGGDLIINAGDGAVSLSNNLSLGTVVGGTATATPININLGSTFGNNALGKNLKVKTYDSASGDNYIYGIGVSANLFEITTANDGQIAFFKNGSTPTEMARINNSGQLTLPYQPAFYAWVSGGSSTRTTGAFTSFSSTRVNRGGHYNTSNGRFTAPIAGVYEFIFSMLWRQSGSGGSGEISIGVNGSNIGSRGLGYSMSLAGGDYHGQTIARAILNLAAGDYVTGWIHSSGDVSANWYFGENLGYFSGHLLG
jgi:type 1 fimbria pilin